MSHPYSPFSATACFPEVITIMDSGRIVHSGRMDALAADEALQKRLLGLSLEVHQ